MSAPLSRRFGQTWYEVLDVKPDATPAQIAAAKTKALRLLTGESLGGYLAMDPTSIAAAIQEVEAATSLLLDPTQRCEYDLTLGIAHPVRTKTPVRILHPVDDRHKEAVRFSAPLANDDGKPPLVVQATVLPQAVMPPPSLAAPPPPPTIRAAPSFAPIDISGEVNGSVLRRVREARQVTLDELAEQTKIRKSHLVAMENQDFQSLPDRVYLRGFLTQVARVLRVDRVALSEGYLDFMARYGGRNT